MHAIRWFVFVVLAVGSLVAITYNMRLMLNWLFDQKGGSVIPFIGGLLGMLALLAAPAVHIQEFCWVPLVLDVGCVSVLGSLAWKAVTRVRP